MAHASSRPAAGAQRPSTAPGALSAIPPHDVEVEQALLSALIRKPEYLDDVMPYIDAADFYVAAHRTVYEAILTLVNSIGSVDIVSLASALKEQGQLDAVGGSVFLANIMSVPGISASHYAQVLRELSRRRSAMDVALRIWEAATDRAQDIEEIAAGTSDMVDHVLANRIDTGCQTPAQVIRDFEDWLDTSMDEMAGIDLPFEKLQRMTGGFLPGEMIVLAARPSNGKTALMLNLCIYALGQGKKVGIVSLEMRTRALMARLCAMARGIDAQKFRSRQWEPGDREQIADFCQRFRTANVRMWDEPEFSPGRMRAIAKAWRRQMGGLDFLVVDYLQLLGSDHVDKRMTYNREQEVARISKALKRLALAEEVPVLLLAQLNRQAEKDSKPMLSHLRESGSLEQDADFVLFLSFWDPRVAGEHVQVDLDVAKGRSSQTGTQPLTYVRRFLRFEERHILGE